jgi:hypothetical protein
MCSCCRLVCFTSGPIKLDALDLYFTICLDGTNKSQQQQSPLLTAWTTGLSSDSLSLCSRYPISIPSGFRGGTCIQQKFSFVRIIIGAEFHGKGKQKSMRYLCAFGWISIIPRIRWRFYLRFVWAGQIGLGPRSPKQQHHPSSTQGRVPGIMTGIDIELGTPKIPKKEKSFVVSCICFLDHQLMYLPLVGSVSFQLSALQGRSGVP